MHNAEGFLGYAGATPTPFAVYRPPIVGGGDLFPSFLGIAHYGVAVLERQREALRSEEQALLAAAEQAQGPDGVLAALRESKARRDEIAAAIREIDAEIGAENERQERDRTAPTLSRGSEGLVTQPGALQVLGPTRLSDAFLDDPTIREWRARTFPNGAAPVGRIESPPAMIAGSVFRPRATLLTGSSSTSGGAFVVNDRTAIFDNALQRPLALRDLITIGSTDSDTVEFVRTTSQTNSAGGVAEATTASTDNQTGLKPESAIAFEVVQPGVKTIAHWIPATTRALADASQLRSIIDDFLRYGLEEEVEDQILSGGGTNEFDGISGTANVQSQGFDTDLLTTTRKARTKVRVGGRTFPTAYVFHPNDWERIDLELSLEGGGTNNRQAGELSAPRLWGLPVVESEAVPEGTGWVANWRMAVLWDRQQTTIRVGEPDNFFLKNMVAVLAELRAAFGVIRPAAFCSIDLTAGS